MAENDAQNEAGTDVENDPHFFFPDWWRLQHYKDRNPPWIKLYRFTQSEPKYRRLSDASKLLAAPLQSLASEHSGVLPYDAQYLREELRLSENTLNDKHLNELQLRGVIVVRACYQDASDALAECKRDASNLLSLEEGEKINKKTSKKNSPNTNSERRGSESREGLSGSTGGTPPAVDRSAGAREILSETEARNFAEIWSLWPAERRGTKKTAERQYLARLREKKTHAAMKSGAEAYLASNPFGIKLLATFLGRDLHFETEWQSAGAAADADSPAPRASGLDSVIFST